MPAYLDRPDAAVTLRDPTGRPSLRIDLDVLLVELRGDRLILAFRERDGSRTVTFEVQSRHLEDVGSAEDLPDLRPAMSAATDRVLARHRL